jgi:hypothetical protein
LKINPVTIVCLPDEAVKSATFRQHLPGQEGCDISFGSHRETHRIAEREALDYFCETREIICFRDQLYGAPQDGPDVKESAILVRETP